MIPSRFLQDDAELTSLCGTHDPKLEQKLYDTFVKMRDLLDGSAGPANPGAAPEGVDARRGWDGELRIRLASRIVK